MHLEKKRASIKSERIGDEIPIPRHTNKTGLGEKKGKKEN